METQAETTPETQPAPAPTPEPMPVAKAEVTPEPAQASSGIAALLADPTVRMQAVPKDEPAPAAPQPAAPKAAAAPASKQPEPAAKPRVAEKKVASAAPAPKAETPARPAPKAATSVPPALGNGAYYVQAGAFATEERAGKIAATLDSMGARVVAATVDGHSVYRVRIGPFLDVRQANAAMEAAHSLGHADVRLVTE
jgi:cell division protein FtsN